MGGGCLELLLIGIATVSKRWKRLPSSGARQSDLYTEPW